MIQLAAAAGEHDDARCDPGDSEREHDPVEETITDARDGTMDSSVPVFVGANVVGSALRDSAERAKSSQDQR
jgi:hypothetical protein